MQPTNVYYGGGDQPQIGNKRPSSRRKLILIVGAILLVLTIAMGIYTSISSSGSTGESSNVLKLISAGDGVKSYELLSPDGKASISREEWVANVVKMKLIIADKNLSKVYTQDLDDARKETAYNVGDAGSVYRIVIVHQSDTGLIDSMRYNLTSL